MFCAKCGKEINDNAKFCAGCGNKIDFTPNQQLNENTNFNQTVDIDRGNPTLISNQPNRNKKTLKISLIVAGVLLAVGTVIFLIKFVTGSSVSDLSVEAVKTGYLTYFSKEKTIGEVFDNYSYFDNVSWKEFEGSADDGKYKANVVEFNAKISIYNYAIGYVNEELTIQFCADDEMKNDEFKVYGIWLTDMHGDGGEINLNDYDFTDILNSIYSNAEFVFIPSDYEIYY